MSESTPRNKLEQAALEAGFTPGAFTMQRLAHDTRMVSRWCEEVERGRIPDELAHLSIAEARKVANKEKAALMAEERTWAEFFYAKLRSQDVTIGSDPSKPFEIKLVRFGDAAE